MHRLLTLAVAVVALGVWALPAQAAVKFEVTCKHSQTAQVDPIVSPGVPVSAHLHTFFGGNPITENTVPADLRGGPTTCVVPDDTAGYWVPQAYRSDTGEALSAFKLFAYYFGYSKATVTPYPAGAEIVAGNSHATGIQGKAVIAWSCGNGGKDPTISPVLDHPYNCLDPAYNVRSSNGVTAIIKFPNCWDQVGTATSDFTYGTGSEKAVCPAGFVRTPKLQEHVHYRGPDGTQFERGDLLTLSSGPSYTLHADWMNAWNQTRFASLVDTCLNAHKNCGFLTK